jgi:hypothetical protein
MTEGVRMAHIHARTTRAEATPPEWLRTGAQIGRLTNTWAGRGDLVAYVGPGAGGPAPACFNPILAEVEVNVDVAFGPGIKPEQIEDLNERTSQFEWPRASGAIFHEALHARFSRWDLVKAQEELTPAEFAAINLLEESRIEAQGVSIFPENRPFLRACALDIVLEDARANLKELTSTRAAAQLAALTLSRIDADVLERDDVEPIAVIIEDFLGEDLLKGLRSVWNRFQMHDVHYNSAPLYELAKEWVKLVEDAAAERGEPQTNEASPEMQAFIEELMDALADAAEATSINAQEDVNDQQTAEEWKDIANTKASHAREAKDHRDVSSDVFSKGTGPMPGTRTASRLIEKRMPTGSERAAAVKVAQMLEKAKYRERDEHEISSILPPGRLRTRAIVQGAALKSKGVMTQAEPWRRTVRKHTDDPTLSVGVMVDISGSMSSAMQPMAVTAWVMSEAAKRVQARCAMVYYGQDVFPTLRPGQNLSEVNVYSAPDGTEKFDRAFKALNGSLDLLSGSGARLLVVVSDGCYTGDETEKAKKWMQRCQESGVGVLWLPFDRDGYAQMITRGTDAVLLADTFDPAKAATAIGAAAAKALTKVGTRNAA